MLDVCICTHNPRVDILKLVVKSLARQTGDPGTFRVFLIDNASFPAVSDEVLDPLHTAGITARIVREPRPGLTQARLRAADETDGEWVLFVDDDNELSLNYLVEGHKFIASRDDVGCFGGRLLLPDTIKPPLWAAPFLTYLGIKDVGDNVIVGKSPDWGIWEPPGAGVFVRRALLEEYRALSLHDSRVFRLGRQGSKSLASCDDSLLMRGAFRLGLANAYNPHLVLYHHLSPNRFKFGYLIRLMYQYGVSHVVLESLLKGPQPMPAHYRSAKAFGKFLLSASIRQKEERLMVPGPKASGKSLLNIFRSGLKNARPFALGMIAYHLGARAEYLKQSKVEA
ncbi:MAG TPA: glycosyltransferase [Terriglobales bacterium]|nr:glycosyltransferase [Terriglobales bacterium]